MRTIVLLSSLPSVFQRRFHCANRQARTPAAAVRCVGVGVHQTLVRMFRHMYVCVCVHICVCMRASKQGGELGVEGGVVMGGGMGGGGI